MTGWDRLLELGGGLHCLTARNSGANMRRDGQEPGAHFRFHMDAAVSRVLVTDAEQRSSLAVVRSLGKAKHEVVVVSHHARALAAASRYVRASYQVPDPCIDPAAFRTAVRRVVEAESMRSSASVFGIRNASRS